MSVPVFNATEKISELPKCLGQIPTVVDGFEKVFKTKPDFVSRSPGRVNLIGEHIDYADFSVLPMAIDVDMLMAIKVLNNKKNPSITLANHDTRFAQRKFDLPLDGSYVTIDASISDWSNYFKCGLHVAHQFLKENFADKFEKKPLTGMEIFCKGSVPTGSGLSSSAAFICATALAIVRANLGTSYKMSKQDLMRITVVAEHYLGVNNGGMDQAASVCGEDDNALYVEFKPALKATAFKFPKLEHSEVNFVIANTLKVSNKVETAPTNYNLRVVEVTVAAEVLAAKYGVSLNKAGALGKGNLRDFMNAYYSKYHNVSKPWDGDVAIGIERLNKMLELVQETFGTHKSGYTVEEASAALNTSKEEFTKDYLTTFPVRFQVLKLYQRAKHVYSEALRVLDALKVMTSGQKFKEDAEFFKLFGGLMNQSQESCDKLYECSCEETDKICEIALSNGSFGSRLTGAGWGGCTVHLVPTENVTKVKTALINDFYKKQYPSITDAELQEAIIVSKPTLGSTLYEL